MCWGSCNVLGGKEDKKKLIMVNCSNRIAHNGLGIAEGWDF